MTSIRMSRRTIVYEKQGALVALPSGGMRVGVLRRSATHWSVCGRRRVSPLHKQDYRGRVLHAFWFSRSHASSGKNATESRQQQQQQAGVVEMKQTVVPLKNSIKPEGLSHVVTVTYQPHVFFIMALCLTFSSVASLVTVMILYVRPVLKAMEAAAISAERAAIDMEKASEEMEKTALLFQHDVPLTMMEVQKASEEWELVGKQLNVVVGSVTRPLKVERPVEMAAESISSVRNVAEKSTARFSRRIVHETTTVANNLWSSINQVAQQLGLRGVSNEAVEEAKRLVYIGRQQQEARSWIDRWRWRTAMRESGRSVEQDGDDLPVSLQSLDDGQVPQAAETKEQELLSRAATLVQDALQDDAYTSYNREHTSVDEDPVAEVFNALARAQAAAEEAAVSSSALERALQKAEESGMLSSSDEDDYQ